METIIRNVGDLTRQDVSALERVVGHQLRESHQLVIQIVSVSVPGAKQPSPSSNLPEWCGVYEGLTDSEIDELDASIVRSSSSRETA